MKTLVCAGLILSVLPAWAHVGSPDVYVKANAGPYALLVSVHPPAVTPGAAEVDVRSEDTGIAAVAVSPEGSEQAPEPLKRFASENFYTGSVWIAAPGAWRVKIHISGSRGEGDTEVPVPASAPAPGATKANTLPVLIGLAIAAGIGIGMGLRARVIHRKTGLALGLTAVLLVPIAVVLGRRGGTQAPPQMQITLLPGGSLSLVLPGRTDDLVPDHAHLLHLFAIRQPEMDVILHLHPARTASGTFDAQLPSMPPGAFMLFADVVHVDGRPETYVASAGLPFQTGRVMQGDDAMGVVPGLARSDTTATSIRLADGYRMTFSRSAAVHARTGQLLRFALLDREGKPPDDMQLYMGMAAHAVILKADGTVFAHIHPAGNIPMAAYGLNMAGMDMSATPASEVSFPFGFPSAGRYRIFVEMKHGGVIETGAFDLPVE